MEYLNYYTSPIGEIVLSADEIGLTGLWLEGQKHSAPYYKKNLPIFNDTKRWLDIYFSGNEPNFKVPLHFIGTEFQKEVWNILCSIPYGKTTTYGEIANQIAKKRKISRMSAQTVGGAVGKNKISVIVPCHRVIGANGNLTGYAGGIDKKIALLKIEKINTENLYNPHEI